MSRPSKALKRGSPGRSSQAILDFPSRDQRITTESSLKPTSVRSAICHSRGSPRIETVVHCPIVNGVRVAPATNRVRRNPVSLPTILLPSSGVDRLSFRYVRVGRALMLMQPVDTERCAIPHRIISRQGFQPNQSTLVVLQLPQCEVHLRKRGKEVGRNYAVHVSLVKAIGEFFDCPVPSLLWFVRVARRIAESLR